MGLERRGRADQGHSEANPQGEEPGKRPEPKVKSFEIDKRLIVEAWEKVRANNGAPGVDAVGIGVFAAQLRDNLFKLWLCRVADYAEWAAPGDRLACWRPWAALIGSA
jgi:hypothetical protein